MSDLLQPPRTIEKVSIVVSKGGLENIYTGFLLGSGARAEGIEANIFFTFFGLEAIHKKLSKKIRVAAVGNPGLRLPTGQRLPSIVGMIPGVEWALAKYFARGMAKLDVPTVPEYIEFLSDTGAGLYACKMASEMFGYTKDDFLPQVKDIITVGEFYGIATGGDIIFT
ncbi:MAG TPA: DsrE/DsrF/DrsH-like family protein [Acidimicrobiales bacterium]|nr:DsrE/DsrF/DrsH-like family protein [Acidimicrobiales bacterium]